MVNWYLSCFLSIKRQLLNNINLAFDGIRLCRNLKSSIFGFRDNPIRGRVKLVRKGA